jgi:hypothetical protein
MISRQAKHQAKRRADGAVTIAVTFRADEIEARLWKSVLELEGKGSPKQALKHLLWLYDNPVYTY